MELVWAQEELSNRGAWSYLAPRLRSLFPDRSLRYAGRRASASPAAGSLHRHREDQSAVVKWASGGVSMERFDLAIIGAGPGGYVAAIRAAQLGQRVALIEKDTALGGTCLNVGCIPSKALLESSERYHAATSEFAAHGVQVAGVTLDLATMMARKAGVVEQLTGGVAGLMKKNKVTVVRGQGALVSATKVAVKSGEGTQELEADKILLASGSVPVELADLPFDGKRVISSTEALSLSAVPEQLLVVGAGAVGLELGLVWLRLGAEVTVVELLPQIVPFADRQLARTLDRSLRAQGMNIRTHTRVSAAEVGDSGVKVTLLGPKDKTEELQVSHVLVAVGRKPCTDGLGLDAAGVALDDRGRVQVNEHLETSVPGIFAIGDLIKGPMLAHKAEEEGVAVAERLAGLPGHVNYDAIPGVVYTTPELSMVGLTEEQAKEQGLEYKLGRFTFRANGRALAAGQVEGLVKILADKATDRIIGVHILGPHASELIAEAVLAMEFSASSEDLARTVHAHPTLAEAVKEAALAVDRRAIHA